MRSKPPYINACMTISATLSWPLQPSTSASSWIGRNGTKPAPSRSWSGSLTSKCRPPERGVCAGTCAFARYPVHKRLADFDFDFQPSLDRAVMSEPSTLRFGEENATCPWSDLRAWARHSSQRHQHRSNRRRLPKYFVSAATVVANLQSAQSRARRPIICAPTLGRQCWCWRWAIYVIDMLAWAALVP